MMWTHFLFKIYVEYEFKKDTYKDMMQPVWLFT